MAQRPRRLPPRTIPATLKEVLIPVRTQDDPRSRGGDGLMTTPNEEPSGRSPLARGRLLQGNIPVLLHRTIPARAGATAPPSVDGPDIVDDPRSRGGDTW